MTVAPHDIDPARFLEDHLARGDLLTAGTHSPLLSNDAIHLATALRLGADGIVTYDVELATAARDAGIRVIAPA